MVLLVDHVKMLSSYCSPSLLQTKYHYSDMKSLYIKTNINIFKTGEKNIRSSQKTKYVNRKVAQVLT